MLQSLPPLMVVLGRKVSSLLGWLKSPWTQRDRLALWYLMIPGPRGSQMAWSSDTRWELLTYRNTSSMSQMVGPKLTESGETHTACKPVVLLCQCQLHGCQLCRAVYSASHCCLSNVHLSSQAEPLSLAPSGNSGTNKGFKGRWE